PHRVVQGPAIGRARRHHLVKQKGNTAGGALYLRQARVEHLPRRNHADFFGHRFGRRNPLYDDAELMRGRRLQRLAVTENGVAAIDGEMQLVAAVAEALGDLLPRPGGDGIDVGDGVWVTHADDADIALADLARAFELDPQLGCRNVAGPGYADGALVVL